VEQNQIAVLPHEVIDQIAAGEVVERPAHLVKELVENSLDAKATQITVEFADGGRFVRVTDNGHGMSRENLSRALDRHATSKIRLSDDLWKLSTFGFRGEALASIAAVSRLKLVSKSFLETSAFQIISDFGRRTSVEEVGGALGTMVQVEDLFANVPARLKFMKSAGSEGTQIKNVMKALALAHPQVEFRVFSEGQLDLVYPATTDRKSRAEQVLGVSPLYEGSALRDGVKSYAVYADPHQVGKTAKNIWLFAQNRWIQDRGLQAAVMEAYRHLLMHGEYPIAVCWVETNPENIDVNIHPSKSQVKFVDSSSAFRAVQASVRDGLEKAPWLASMSATPAASVTAAVESFSLEASSMHLQFHDEALRRTQYQQKNWQPSTFSSPELMVEKSETLSVTTPPPTDQNVYWSKLQVLAQAHLTYIITQSAQGLVIIDQHAAHERVMFERLMRAWSEKDRTRIDVQEFLFPLALDLSVEQVEALLPFAQELQRLGISIEALGPSTLGVKSAPALLREKALAQALENMAHEIVSHGGSFVLEKKIGDIVATMACHSAIRAGQALSLEEMTALLQSMDEFPLSSFCPHGRPVSVDYSFYQLEKDFGRIV
jgi:DNA mismatch repair protein MutL